MAACDFNLSPKVSIITVCKNSMQTIESTVESVLAQDYKNIEYIIIDGGSNDETLSIVNKYSAKISSIISESDNGIYDAMNKGLSIATGDLIGFINSDDLYADSASVRKLVDRMESANVDSVFADLVIVDRDNTDKIIRYYNSENFHPSHLRYGWMPAHTTFITKRSIYEKYGNYSLNYRIAADFEIMTRFFLRAGISYVHLPEVVIRMRSGGLSTCSWKNRWILNKEIVKACRDNGVNTSLPRVLLKIPKKLLEHVYRPDKG